MGDIEYVATLIDAENYETLMRHLDDQSTADLAEMLVKLEIGKKAVRMALGVKREG